MLSLSLVVRVAGVRHKEIVALDEISSTRGPGRGALLLYAHLAHPLTEAANLAPSTNCRPRMYCNRAGTHWYTMDKGKSPDRRKPPK